MFDKTILQNLHKIFKQYPEIIAVYLFGSYRERGKQAGDVDLAVLLGYPVKSQVDLYMDLYPRLAEVFSPLEVDLLFLNTAPLPVGFEVISTGQVVYCPDDDRRTDFEYVVSGRYMDFKHHLEAARRELYEALKEETSLV